MLSSYYPKIFLTCAADWPDAVFIEGEALFQCMGSHVFVEHIRAGEVKDTTEVLVMRQQSNVQPSMYKFILQHTYTLCKQIQIMTFSLVEYKYLFQS